MRLPVPAVALIKSRAFKTSAIIRFYFRLSLVVPLYMSAYNVYRSGKSKTAISRVWRKVKGPIWFHITDDPKGMNAVLYHSQIVKVNAEQVPFNETRKNAQVDAWLMKQALTMLCCTPRTILLCSVLLNHQYWGNLFSQYYCSMSKVTTILTVEQHVNNIAYGVQHNIVHSCWTPNILINFCPCRWHRNSADRQNIECWELHAAFVPVISACNLTWNEAITN